MYVFLNAAIVHINIQLFYNISKLSLLEVGGIEEKF